LVVCSTAFLYIEDHGRPLETSSPIAPRAETAEAFATERAAELFKVLRGRSVVLRLGWVFGDHDPISGRVVSMAAKGWRLIEGDPHAAISSIAATDAAAAILAAPAAPPGLYNVSDGRPVSQAAVNASLEWAAGNGLHSLYDPAWGSNSTLCSARRGGSPTWDSPASPAGRRKDQTFRTS